MTEPTPPSRWSAFRARRQGRDAGKSLGSRFNPLVVASIVIGVVLVLALAVWVNALTAPVEREGRPTASVTPIPAPTTATPTPTLTPTPTSGGTESATPAPTPSSTLPKVKASGKFDTAGVNVAAANSSGELRRFSVRVETTTALDADKVGTQIAGVLNDPRSWAGSGNVRFALVGDPGKADFTISIAAPATAKKSCAPEPSTCVDGGDLVIDASYWLGGQPPEYPSKSQWQAYLVNHAVGHLLGEKHEGCAKKGKAAPAMMPQEGDLDGCTPNPWPFP
ncbi:MAG: DUF3152 domain-containing protein [Propionicimonas sp.]|uniref:DUF3152 domain-containing protein n=1 Tax=Propionicimonas sp. TaxID=1955623 RepID=UPI003D1511D4